MMSNNRDSVFESSDDFLDCYVKDSIGVIHLKDRVFEIASDLSLKGTLFDKIRLAEKCTVIKVLLVVCDDSILGEEQNSQFWKNIVESHDGDMQLIREVNALSQYIEMMCSFGKIVVSAVRGSVVGAFLGAILSTDFRVASDSTVFSFPYMQYRMPPQGALAFLLPRYIGIAKAKSILLRAEPIQASQVLGLGLVDKVLPNTGFEKACLEYASELTHLAPEVVGMTKRLFECSMKELHTYFEMETKLLGLHKVTLPPDEAHM